MPRRTRIAEGVYKDRYGLAATVKVAGVQRECRFPADTAMETIKHWRIQTRATLDEDRPSRAAAGTLRKDGDAFLAKMKTTAAGARADRFHLCAWYAAFGDTQRRELTTSTLQRQIATWQTAGVAARTLRHRCRVLRECFRFHDGTKARTPVEAVKLPSPPQPNPVAVPVKTIQAVAASMKKAGRLEDYARFLIRALTGQRPAQIMRAEPSDIDLVRKVWFVRSAKGGNAVPFPLTTETAAAWKVFAKANAWGPFNTQRAAEVARRHGWPASVKLYALRSTFAIDLMFDGATLRDVQGLLGHKQYRTTELHYAAMQVERLRRRVNRRRLVPAGSASRRSRTA